MMKLLVVIVLLWITVGAAQEKATLTTAQTVSITDYDIMRIDMQRLPEWGLRIYYRDNDSKVRIDEHSGNDAATYVKALNKANLSVKSLECRAIEHLVSEGRIAAATCTGSPQ